MNATSLEPLLSIVIISHNQKELLRRCIDSVLAQKTTFPVQVIVSDDRSTDGTREMLVSEYGDKVKPLFFDSDKTMVSITLERASFNRLNGLRYATGKYLIHIDGDDLFTGSDLFQTMVDNLESHPECSVCCQNFCWVDEDKLYEENSGHNKSRLFLQDCIVTSKEFRENAGYLHNSCFCVRRVNNSKLKYLNIIPYDDSLITARYLNSGKVLILNRCNFVYVRYPKSSFNSIQEEVRRIIFQPGIQQIILHPESAGDWLMQNVGIISYIAKKSIKRILISEEIAEFLKKQPIWIYNRFNSVNLLDKSRFLLIYLLTYFMQGAHTDNCILLKILYRLAIGKPTRDTKV